MKTKKSENFRMLTFVMVLSSLLLSVSVRCMVISTSNFESNIFKHLNKQSREDEIFIFEDSTKQPGEDEIIFDDDWSIISEESGKLKLVKTIRKSKRTNEIVVYDKETNKVLFTKKYKKVIRANVVCFTDGKVGVFKE